MCCAEHHAVNRVEPQNVKTATTEEMPWGGGGVEGKISTISMNGRYIDIFCNHITYVILLQLPWICWVHLVQPVHHEIECANLIRAGSLLIDWGQSIREVMG